MAKNPPKGPGRRGAVSKRSQSQGRDGVWTKRNTENGQFMDRKADGKPFKGVRRER